MLISHTRPSRSKSWRTRRSKLQVRFETLESRLLMSTAAISTFAIGAVNPYGITHDNAGNIWVAGGDGLYKVGADGQQVGDPAVPGTTPFDVVFNASNGDLYYSDTNVGQIVEVGLDGTVIHTTTMPDAFAQAPTNLTVANDGSVWFSTTGASTGTNGFTADIGRLDLSNNLSFTTFNGATPGFLAAASDGSVWFGVTGYGSGTAVDPLLANSAIGRAHAASDGSIAVDSLYAISTPASMVQQITVASDNSVWFGLSSRGPDVAGDGPNRIVHGVLTGGTLVQTEYVIPGATASSAPIAGSVALDSVGRLWFTDQNNNRLSFMDTSTGDFTQMALPSTIAMPLNLNIAGNNLWATALSGGDNLIRLDLSFVPPVMATSPNIDATEGVAFTGPLVTFQTTDNGPVTYSVDYGNGQTATGSMAQNSSGVYSLGANVTYTVAGSYDTTVTITTGDGNLVTVRGTAVASSATTAMVGEGINLSGPEDVALAANRTIGGVAKLAVATFSGPAAAYSAIITWGDSTSSAGQIVDLGGGLYAVVAPSGKTYSTNGTFTGSVEISGGPSPLTVGFTATISDTPLVASTGLTLRPLFGRIVLTAVATFTDDIDSTASWFSATISWGDGSRSSGLIVRDPSTPGKFIIIGLHVYGHKGTYNVLTLITSHQENVSATATATIQIN